MDAPRVIVGLGNPGPEYSNTRHNAGFLVLAALARAWGAEWQSSRRFRAMLAKARRSGQTVWMCQPQTYMNLSGESVGAVLAFHRVPPERCVVVVDDADLPLGTVRLRPGGSSGGHHGLESIERQLGTREYPRLRVGIGRLADGRREITGHVLGRFGADEQKLFASVTDRVVAQLEVWVAEGLGPAMNRYNGSVENAETK